MSAADGSPAQSAVEAQNRRGWDALAKAGQRLTKPAEDRDFADPMARLDPRGWLGDVRGRRILCLASGGGRQSALFAAAGAMVTVVDLSPAMLAQDRQIAAERGLAVRTIEASMNDLSSLAADEFDIVYQPVSTCYVPDVRVVYRQVARVLVGGGLYVSQHKQPASLQAEQHPLPGGGYAVTEAYYRTEPLANVTGSLLREPGTLEFLHRLEDLVGGLCQSGFVIEDLVEPFHAEMDASDDSFGHRAKFLPPYLRIKARKTAGVSTGAPTAASSGILWTP